MPNAVSISLITVLINVVVAFGGFETETEEVRSLTQRHRTRNSMTFGGYPNLYPGGFPGGYTGGYSYGGGFGYSGGFRGGYGSMIPPLNPRVYTDPAPMPCCGVGGLYA